MSPQIPINPDDLPTGFEPLDESLTYTAIIRMMGEGTDKNGNAYITTRNEITAPEEWAGKIVYDNYIPLPQEVSDSMDAKERRRAMEAGVRLGQLVRSAKLKGGPSGFHTDDLIGCEVTFTISNEEYQGQIRSRPRNYLVV